MTAPDDDDLFCPSDTLGLAEQIVHTLDSQFARERLLEYLGILACWEIEANPAAADDPTVHRLAAFALQIREQERQIEQESVQWQRGRLRLQKIRQYLRKATSRRAASRSRSAGSKQGGTSRT